MFVSGRTTEVEANMLKGIMSQLQLNTLAGNLVKNRQNNLPKPDSVSAQYSVMEVSKIRRRTNHSVCQYTTEVCGKESCIVLLLISCTHYVLYTLHRFLLVYVSDQ